jgi:anti-sigma B factor antagonist
MARRYEPMDTKVFDERGVTIVEVAGDVDVSKATELRDLLGGLVGETGPGVLVDLDGVRFIDSAGIGILVTAQRRAGEAGRRFGVAAPGAAVARAFELTRTNRVLDVFPSLEEGISALAT